MFRRRGLGRRFERLFRHGRHGRLASPLASPPGLPPDEAALAALQEAQRIEGLGHYAEAAELYERLAYHAQQRNHLRQAARLYLRASACRIQGEQPGLGFPSMQQAFRLLAAAQEWRDLQRLGRRAEAGLHRMGYTTQAEELHRLLQDLLARTPFQPPAGEPPAQAPPPARLPSHCTRCGATLDPNEVEWLDSRTAECAYCGSPVPAA